ncbi:MAG: hypothetical protein Q9163_006278, partial [Psora crenata]
VIAHDACDDAKDHGAPGRAVARRRGRGHQTRDGAGTPADHGPLPRQPPVQDGPCHGGEGGSQTGVPAGLNGPQVGTKGRAPVEAEPSEPEKGGSQDDQRDVVRTEIGHHLLLTPAQDEAVRQRGQTGADFDRPSPGVVQHAVIKAPSAGIPHPTGDRAVDEGRPEEDEDHEREHPASLRSGSGSDGGCGGAELHLCGWGEDCFSGRLLNPPRIRRGQWTEFGDQGRGFNLGSQSIHQAEMLQIADEAIGGLPGEGEGVPPKVPLEGDDGVAGHADPYHRQGGFPTGEAGVEEAQSRDHDEDHGGRHDDVGLIPGGIPLVEILRCC